MKSNDFQTGIPERGKQVCALMSADGTENYNERAREVLQNLT